MYENDFLSTFFPDFLKYISLYSIALLLFSLQKSNLGTIAFMASLLSLGICSGVELVELWWKCQNLVKRKNDCKGGPEQMFRSEFSSETSLFLSMAARGNTNILLFNFEKFLTKTYNYLTNFCKVKIYKKVFECQSKRNETFS